MNRIARFVLTGLAALLIPPAGLAYGSAQDRAERALAEAEALFGDDSASIAAAGGREGTGVMRELAIAIPLLSGAERRRARAILRRPDQGSDADHFGPEDPASPLCEPRFCIHWGTKEEHRPPAAGTSPGDGVPDYVEAVLAAAARSYEVENETLGWRDPVSDGGRGGGDQVDIYLAALERGLFGYAAPDPGQTGRSRSAYLVVDNDFSGFGGDPLELMRVTIAHEYNHILHFGYDTFQDLWMFESTATWIEDLVYPEINDYFNFLPVFARKPQKPLAEPDQRASKLYGSAVWNHWLAAAHGAATIRRAWEVSPLVRPAHFAVGAYDRAIGDRGGRSFSREFVEFAAATAEWRSSSAFPDAGLYPDMRRSGRLGSRVRTGKLDHTAYRLYRVRGRGTVMFRGKVQRGTRAGIALVGRSGPQAGGTVEVKLRYLRRGGRGGVRLKGIGRFDRVTAVVVNADGRVRGGSRDYVRDRRKVRLRIER